MKSKLNFYKRLAHLPMKKILSTMHLNEDQLYKLMTIWIKQGKIKESNQHFQELKKNQKNKVTKRKHQLNEEHYASYQYLRHEGHSDGEIAEILGSDTDKMSKFGTRWYKELRREDMSFEEIKEETKMTDSTLRSLQADYDRELEITNEAKERELKHNAKDAYKKLKAIKKDMETNAGDYVIIDLEGVQNPDEILEVAVIDLEGNELLNTIVRPTHGVGWHVHKLTGITNKMASKGIGLYSLMRSLKRIVGGKHLISWGTDYDQVLLNSAMQRTKINLNCNFVCAQHIHMGVTNDPNQMALYKASGEEQPHRALGDCKMVLKVLREDIESYLPDE